MINIFKKKKDMMEDSSYESTSRFNGNPIRNLET